MCFGFEFCFLFASYGFDVDFVFVSEWICIEYGNFVVGDVEFSVD